MGTENSLLAVAGAIVTVLTAAAKLFSMLGKARTDAEVASWKRRDEMIDDLREDIERVRGILKDRDEECTQLRKDLNDCWRQYNNIEQRRYPRPNDENGPPL